MVVNHHTALEAARCLESLREAFRLERIAGEILLVDCASGDEELSRLRTQPADLVLALTENRGYSGGLNAGLARARGSKLILSNADVIYWPGALTALLGAIEAPAIGAVAPLSFWDAKGRIRLPPGFAPSFFSDLAQLATGLWPSLDARRFSAFARETRRLWEEGGDARHLTGAVLAARREVFDRVGRFDERFLFEYEETEWEERLRAAGLRLRFVPSAKVHHLYARSAARSRELSERRALFSQSLYRRRRYGRLGQAVLERARSLSRPTACEPISEPRFLPHDGASLAISPNPSLLPFAETSLQEGFTLPDDVLASLVPGPLYFRAFRSADGEPLQSLVWEKRT